MKELTRTECADWLLARDNFAILSHRKPDGDTLGSCAALCRGLRALGKTAHILANEDLTPLYAPLVEGLTKPEAEEGDILIAVDVAADNMLPQAFMNMKNCIDLRIDHQDPAGNIPLTSWWMRSLPLAQRSFGNCCWIWA